MRVARADARRPAALIADAGAEHLARALGPAGRAGFVTRIVVPAVHGDR